jgi:integrase
VSADREQPLKSADLLGLLTLARPLWQAIEATLPSMGASDQTRKRYEVSLAAVRTKGRKSLDERATVADLEGVRWGELRGEWGRSPADWNHLRRAISAFLSALLTDKFHPFRRAVLTRFPIAAESSRTADATPDVFWRILDNVPTRYRACYVALVATGMRDGEYLRCTRFHLKAATFTVSVPGTETASSAERVAVHPQLWSHVEAAIPSPIQYKALRRIWKAPCEKAKADVRIHDLRHCFGQ